MDPFRDGQLSTNDRARRSIDGGSINNRATERSLPQLSESSLNER